MSGDGLVVKTLGFQPNDRGFKSLSPHQLKEIILRDVEEFRSAKTREEKQEVLQIRNVDNIKHNKEYLVDVLKTHNVINKWYRIEDVDFDNIQPELISCEKEEQKKVWTYFRFVVSSLPWTGYYGRKMQYLLVDKNSKCVMGILGLGSDFMAMKARDDYIGWSKEDKHGVKFYEGGQRWLKPTGSWQRQKELGIQIKGNKINNLMCIHTCVPLQPFGTLFFGKFMAMMSFSDEILNHFEERYGQKLVGLTTTSVYGESIQYNGISDFMKFVGYSKGLGTVQFKQSTVEQIRKYYYSKHKKSVAELGLQPKARMIVEVLKDLELKNSLLRHEHIRGVYFGYTHVNSRMFLTNFEVYPNGRPLDENEIKMSNEQKEYRKVEMRSPITEEELIRFENRKFQDIFELWKNSFYLKRLEKKRDELNIEEWESKYNVYSYFPQQLMTRFMVR